MTTTMMKRLKKSPSEDFVFPSLFLVFHAKGEGENLFSYYYLFILDCNMRLSVLFLKFHIYPSLCVLV
jgi:hypothetical protein